MLCLLLCACGKEQPVVTEPETTVALTEATTEATQPETVAAAPVVITKHPTDETLAPGGKTWFVAHADNATSVKWEFLSPEGVAYSVAETVEKNPGLFLDVSTTDTIALEKIPLSLNGWSCYAHFTGPGGTADTNAAKITVTRSEGAYDTVIARYKTAVEAKAGSSSAWAAENGVSEMILYASHAGYAKIDLDGNGVEELIIAGIGYDIPDEPYIFEIFTIQNDTAVSVGQSRARSRLYLMQDGKIFNEGSSGAAYSNFSVMQLSGTELRFLNGLYTTDLKPDGTSCDYTYYYTTSNQFGALEQMHGDNSLDEKVAMTFLNGWRDSLYLPELCYIA